MQKGFETFPIDTIHDDSLEGDYVAYVKHAVDIAMYPFPNAKVEVRRLSPTNAQLNITTPSTALCLHLLQLEGERQNIWRLPHTVPTAYAIGNALQRISADVRRFVYSSHLAHLNRYESERRNDYTFEVVKFIFSLYENDMIVRLKPNIGLDSAVGYHNIDLTHHNDLLWQDDGFFTDWAEKNQVYLLLANVSGALEANGNYVGATSW